MPSPFPGMNPYLEGALWTTFHFAFGAEIVQQLAPRPRPYLARPVERFVIEASDDIAITANIYLDVGVAKSARETSAVYAPSAMVLPLDLQQTFTATYDLLGYDLAIDYTCPPEPLLDDEAMSMADSLLRTAGLRPA